MPYLKSRHRCGILQIVSHCVMFCRCGSVSLRLLDDSIPRMGVFAVVKNIFYLCSRDVSASQDITYQVKVFRFYS